MRVTGSSAEADYYSVLLPFSLTTRAG